MYPGNTDAVGGRMIVKAEGGGAPEKLVEKCIKENFCTLKRFYFHVNVNCSKNRIRHYSAKSTAGRAAVLPR